MYPTKGKQLFVCVCACTCVRVRERQYWGEGVIEYVGAFCCALGGQTNAKL